MASGLQTYASANNYKIPDHQHQTAFNTAFQSMYLVRLTDTRALANFLATKSFYQYYHTVDKERGKRFDSAMERYFHRSSQTPVEDFFDFGKLSHHAIVVDVGGGRGHHSIRLASQYPHMFFINQDLGKMEPTLKEVIQKYKLLKVVWQEHNFFKEQPIQGASLYLLSHILMDHPDRLVQRKEK